MARWLNTCSQLPYNRRDLPELSGSLIRPRRRTWELNDCNKTAGVALFNSDTELYKWSEGILGCFTYTEASQMHIRVKVCCQVSPSFCACYMVLCQRCLAQVGLWEGSDTGLLPDGFIKKHLFSVSSYALAQSVHTEIWGMFWVSKGDPLSREKQTEQRKKNSTFPKHDLGIHLTFTLFNLHSTSRWLSQEGNNPESFLWHIQRRLFGALIRVSGDLL